MRARLRVMARTGTLYGSSGDDVFAFSDSPASGGCWLKWKSRLHRCARIGETSVAEGSSEPLLVVDQFEPGWRGVAPSP